MNTTENILEPTGLTEAMDTPKATEPESAPGDIGFQRELRQIYSKQVLAKGEDQRLFRVLRGAGTPQQVEQARQRLMDGVAQYVVKVARSYQGRGVELEDLIQEGFTGVMVAMDKFDPEMGFAFLTYADDWIRQRMSRACTDKGSIEKHGMRLPCHMYMAVGRVQKEYAKLQDQLGREPTPEELATAARIKLSAAVTALEVISRSTMSMDANRASDDSEVSLREAIADEQAVDPIDEISYEEQRDAIWGIYQQLTEQEQQVLAMRKAIDVPGLELPAGVERGVKYTQEGVCEALNLRKSRMIAIEKRAEAKLRASDVLADMADDVLANID